MCKPFCRDILTDERYILQCDILLHLLRSRSVGDVTVLIYYAITSFAALRLTSSERLYPVWVGWLGLVSCLFLAFWVESAIWQVGLGLIVGGLIWHKIRRAIAQVP